MNDLFRRIEFRLFSYEADPEYLVDMHRCREVLEGGWFDSEEMCRYNHKVVVRSCGSSWVASIGRAVIGHADLVRLAEKTGMVVRWRLHPDFHHPKVTKIMVDGLREAAKKREYDSLIFWGDVLEVVSDLEAIGLKKDRCYRWVNLDDVEPRDGAEIEAWNGSREEALDGELLSYLGSPLPAKFLLQRAYMASEYGVSNFHRPKFFRITVSDREYIAGYDGREWFIFRRQKHAGDAEAIPAVLSALSSVGASRMLLSGKVLEMTGIVPASDETMWDLCSQVSGK